MDGTRSATKRPAGDRVGSATEREALTALYLATDGPNWTRSDNWLSNAPLDEWYGVVTDSEGRVNWLTLWDNGLKGPIVPDLGNLPALAFLGLGDNELTGEVPVELASATALTALWIENNLLTGAIPSSFLDLSELRVLDFSGNDELCVPGTVRFREWTDAVSLVVGPDCSAADAEILRVFHERTGGGFWTNSDGWLSDAALSEWHGVETDTIGRVTGLGMSSNGLSGELPDSLSELSALVKLDVSGNILAGALPVTLAALDLVELRYSDTRLCVPQEDDFLEWLAGIAQHEGSGRQCPPQDPREILKTFYYATGGDHTWNQSDNWLTDAPLDQWFGVSTDASGNVTRLELDGNFLVGRIPAELGQLTHLVSLNLSWNGLLEGPLPPEFSNLTSLTGLYLQGTDLGGPLPPEIGQLAGLERLYLNSASLTGPLPPELGNLTNLRRLVMGGNYLSGPIPAELGNLTNLTVLNLYYNEHEGRIPPELGNLSGLEELSLGRNHLVGEVPEELGDLEYLTELVLNNNELSGGIPASFGNLTRLWELRLNDNSLSGTVPASLGNLSGLSLLRLHNNALTGGLPAEIGNLNNLRELWVGDNEGLAGPVPTRFSGLSRLRTFKAGGTDLCAPQDAGFLNWLRGVPFHRLPRCEPALAYLTQTVQSRDYPVPLVGGRPALLRVFIASPQASGAAMPEVRATFYADGTEIHAARIAAGSGTISTEIDESSLDHSANADIPGDVIQSGLEVVIEVDPDGTLDPGHEIPRRIPATGRMAIDVVDLPDLPLTLIPFLYEPDPDEAILDITAGMAADPENHPMLKETRDFMPVGGWDVWLHDPVLTSTTSGFTIRNETELMRRMEGARPGYWLGMQTPIRFGLLGVAYGIPSWTSFSQALPATVAHEIGHNMGLWHAPCGGAGGPDPLYPHPWGVIGAWGYDRENRRLVSPHTPDLMSYCGGGWISEYHLANAMRHRVDTEQAAGDWTPTRALLVWGGLDAGGQPYLEPSFIADALPGLPPAGNDYLLRGTTEDGREAFSYRFDMPVTLDVDDGRSGFVFAIPITWDGTISRIRLSGAEDSFVLDGDTDLPMTILRDPVTGQIRAILRRPVAQAMDAVGEPNFAVLFSRGIPE